LTKISLPLIVVNFKTYREVEGSQASHIACICEEVMKQTGRCIAVCPPMVELSSICSLVDNPVICQHVDPLENGAHTGWVTPSMARAAGAKATLINHSEHRLSSELVRRTVEISRSIGLDTIVCVDTPEMAKKFAHFGPNYIAVEPPELIGGEVSVTTAKPEVVSDAVQAVREVDDQILVLCGAGVKNGKDVKAALDLGTNGVLVSSGVVKAPYVKKALQDLVSLI
jgi:triosephosphate isomerase (TIM)